MACDEVTAQALSSCIYYSLRDYMLQVLSAPIISSTLKL
jgi:hypothetical protein